MESLTLLIRKPSCTNLWKRWLSLVQTKQKGPHHLWRGPLAV